jgi:hypothetical protein
MPQEADLEHHQHKIYLTSLAMTVAGTGNGNSVNCPP